MTGSRGHSGGDDVADGEDAGNDDGEAITEASMTAIHAQQPIIESRNQRKIKKSDSSSEKDSMRIAYEESP